MPRDVDVAASPAPVYDIRYTKRRNETRLPCELEQGAVVVQEAAAAEVGAAATTFGGGGGGGGGGLARMLITRVAVRKLIDTTGQYEC